MTKTAPDKPAKKAPLARVMQPINHVVERWIPSSLVFAIVLTVIVALLALIVTPTSPVDLIVGWGDGLAGLLAFMTQMALILLLGHMLANTKPVRRLLDWVAEKPNTPMQAYLLVFVTAAVASLITWGLGLVVGGLLAKEVARSGRDRGLKLHFPMLVAAGFSGFVVWHMGYSGSGPLTAATPDSFISEQLGYTIPITETTFSWWNISAAVATIVLVSVALWAIAPRGAEKIVQMPSSVGKDESPKLDDVETPADRIDASRIPTLLVGLMLSAYIVIHFVRGGQVTLDIVNWMFLALILLMVRNPFEVIALTKNAASNVGEILLQFPLYAGIMGIMSASGLIQIFSDMLVSIANPITFGLFALLSAGLVNFFVPSGGGQFAVQAPIMLDAAEQLGVDPAIAIMAVSYGDQWTNMIQPFWAIPLLAIAGLKMRDILGYTTATLVASGLVFGGALVVASIVLQ
ncbi:MAG: short-chain fatty acid transporter [Agrococcus casei]|uniref:Short chain fatty acids transporter n=3 Tax=Agrococcus TaxID=46352 RepID=A0A1R4EXT7_9MICO|nr:TIGR00366 family protein [Agrococcus casei]SJM48449.1 Short chain fatty acids transporter [Agrococcus casei LMG 22410]